MKTKMCSFLQCSGGSLSGSLLSDGLAGELLVSVTIASSVCLCMLRVRTSETDLWTVFGAVFVQQVKQVSLAS